MNFRKALNSPRIVLIVGISFIEVFIVSILIDKLLSFYLPSLLVAIIACNIKFPYRNSYVSEKREICVCFFISIIKNMALFILFFRFQMNDKVYLLNILKTSSIDILLSSSVGAFYSIHRYNKR